MMKVTVFLALVLLETHSADTTYTYQNVALRGKATQSGRYLHSFGAAYNAIDGNRESVFDAGSCTHSSEQSNPWWRVDLLEPYIVTSIIITNRGDCCEHRLNDVEVYIGNSLQDNGVANQKVGTIAKIGLGESFILPFTNRVEGRYVVLLLPGEQRYLTLCEVEVYGHRAPTGENLAFHGKATQSSLFYYGTANNAIDGDRASTVEDGSCSHTVATRDKYQERLSGAEIRIGDSLEDNGNNNTRCAVIRSVGAGEVVDFQCEGMDGRYINIVIPGRKEFLTLCEVEVYGSHLD
uniref:fucolectin-1-like isoform X2 n=1 Tax=Semicossyphus pulcher TaxID=241346 RepID=UPI0037E8C1F0